MQMRRSDAGAMDTDSGRRGGRAVSSGCCKDGDEDAVPVHGISLCAA